MDAETQQVIDRLEARVAALEKRIQGLDKRTAHSMMVGAPVPPVMRDGAPTDASFPSPNPWRTHDSDQMPDCYAPAQLVEVEIYSATFNTQQKAQGEARNIAWPLVEKHRPLLRCGLPCVSAEGLAPWARYVATDADGMVNQSRNRLVCFSDDDQWWPAPKPVGGSMPAPDTHRIPGDWRESLAFVVREDE